MGPAPHLIRRGLSELRGVPAGEGRGPLGTLHVLPSNSAKQRLLGTFTIPTLDYFVKCCLGEIRNRRARGTAGVLAWKPTFEMTGLSYSAAMTAGATITRTLG